MSIHHLNYQPPSTDTAGIWNPTKIPVNLQHPPPGTLYYIPPVLHPSTRSFGTRELASWELNRYVIVVWNLFVEYLFFVDDFCIGNTRYRFNDGVSKEYLS